MHVCVYMSILTCCLYAHSIRTYISINGKRIWMGSSNSNMQITEILK